MNKLFTAIATAYRKVTDHLTKLLGLAGATAMAASEWIDPDSVMGAATQFLHDPHWVKRIGTALFVLIIARGWWTGRQVKQLKAAIAPPSPPGAPQ